jgi:uncharacterized integral membrane protein
VTDLVTEVLDEPVESGDGFEVNVLRSREKVRAWLVGALLSIVVALLAVYGVAAWKLEHSPWERVNAVLGIGLAAFLTLLGSAVAWYFSEQARMARQ